MNITETLMQEHQFILKYLALMQAYMNRDDLLSHKDKFIAFIQEFADNLHHGKEEDCLFHYLTKPNVLTHCNPIPQMLHEHNQARELVNIMAKSTDLSLLKTALTQYIDLLTQHIFKEDNILYPMAERGLSELEKQELLLDYQYADEQINSLAIWQRYETLYTELNANLS